MSRHLCWTPALLGATALATLLSAAPLGPPLRNVSLAATPVAKMPPAASANGWIDPAQIATLVLFFPPVKTSVPPPGDPNDPGPNDPGPNNPGPNDPGPQDPPPDPPPGDPPNVHGDPPGPGGPPVTHNPEPASLISGILGAGMIAYAGWRRRRRG